MTYINCKGCNKRFYKSPYFKGKYSQYCNQCGSIQLNKDKSNDVQYMSTGCRKLVRTDTEEEYLDSTYCEYSQEEVKAMRGAKSLYSMKISKLRDEIKEKYSEIHRLEEKINKINTKIAVAEREQHLRKKLRRETRLLLPSLETVNRNVNNVKKNLLSTLHNDNDDSDSIPSLSSDDEFIKDASELLNKLNNETVNINSNNVNK